MSRPFVLIIVACALVCPWSEDSSAQAEAAPLLLRDPSLSETQVAFAYAGYIWVANRDGTGLRRLTSGGHEAKPVFSPDGSQVAFVGDYDGARAAYLVPSAGGQARRLTYHPADLGIIDTLPDVLGWTPDGKRVVFNSRWMSFVLPGRYFTSQLFTVPADGGFVATVPLSRAMQASFSADGSRIAYVPNVQRQLVWKRYRGGETTPIWIADLADSSIVAKIPRDNSNDFNPMWVGERIYFLSDRKGPVTLFSYDLKSLQVQQVLENTGLDIKSASAHADAIVYEQFGSLHLLNLRSGDNRILNLRPEVAVEAVRPHFKKVEPSQIKFAGLSPTGARILFGVRGEVMSVSAESDDAQRLLSSGHPDCNVEERHDLDIVLGLQNELAI